MLSHLTKLKSLPLAALLSATAMQSAWAWEAEEVAARYKTLLALQGLSAEWKAARRDGDSIVLEGASFGLHDVDEKIELGDFLLADVSETDSIYEIGRIALDRFQQSRENFDIKLSGLSVEGLVLPKEAEEMPYGGMMQYRHFSLDEVQVNMSEKPVFTLDTLKANTTLGNSSEKISFSGAVERFWLDIATLAESEEARSQLRQYDYEELSGRIDMDGSWALDDGRLKITRYDARIDNAGTLAFAADVSGYTPEFIQTLQEMQKSMATGSEKQKQAQSFAMIGLMQQLNLHGLSIRFSDASLTGKLIAYVAEQQGIKPQDVAQQAKAIVPLLVGQYLGPGLTTSLSRALNTYIDNPRNLTISVEPEDPMPFAVIFGTAMGSPDALAEEIGLSISAND